MLVKAIWFNADPRCEQDMFDAGIVYGLDGLHGNAISVIEEASWIDEFKKLLRDDYGIDVVAEEEWTHRD